MDSSKPKKTVKHSPFLYLMLVLTIATMGVCGTAGAYFPLFIDEDSGIDSPKVVLMIKPTNNRRIPEEVSYSERSYTIIPVKSEAVGEQYVYEFEIRNYNEEYGTISEFEYLFTMHLSISGNTPCDATIFRKIGSIEDKSPTATVQSEGIDIVSGASSEYYFSNDTLQIHFFRLYITYPSGYNASQEGNSCKVNIDLTWHAKK